MIPPRMSKERFTEILKEYNISNDLIFRFWNTRPFDNLDEGSLRVACESHRDLDKLRRSQRQ